MSLVSESFHFHQCEAMQLLIFVILNVVRILSYSISLFSVFLPSFASFNYSYNNHGCLSFRCVHNRLYPGWGIGSQGRKRRRRLCKAQPISIMRSRVPLRKRRQTSLRIRQRLTPLLTCSIATLRRARA